jgi:hypothetical protein
MTTAAGWPVPSGTLRAEGFSPICPMANEPGASDEGVPATERFAVV